MNKEILDRIIEGCFEGEVFVEDVDTTGNGDYVELDCYLSELPKGYMCKTWRTYLHVWLENNSTLIEKALEDYELWESSAWGFGIDVAHTVLRSGVGFSSRGFLDAEVADLLDDSLDEHKTDDGLHEFWIEDDELRVSRWVHVDEENN